MSSENIENQKIDEPTQDFERKRKEIKKSLEEHITLQQDSERVKELKKTLLFDKKEEVNSFGLAFGIATIFVLSGLHKIEFRCLFNPLCFGNIFTILPLGVCFRFFIDVAVIVLNHFLESGKKNNIGAFDIVSAVLAGVILFMIIIWMSVWSILRFTGVC